MRGSRLGNHMFWYASLKGIASAHGYDYCFPKHGHQLFDIFDLKCKIGYINKLYITSESLLKYCPDNVSITGYLHSDKYFSHIKKEIKNDFKFKNIKKSDFIDTNEKLISMHVRRGDYLKTDKFIKLNFDYYEKALSIIDNHNNNKISVLVFSDDYEWCKKNFTNKRFIIMNNSKEIDMYLMTKCKWHIIANSTFSWWGAYLSDSELVIAPKNYYKDEIKNNNYSIPATWLKI